MLREKNFWRVLWVCERWEIADGSIYVWDAILSEEIWKMHPWRHISCQIQGTKCSKRMLKKDDGTHEKNEDMITINQKILTTNPNL